MFSFACITKSCYLYAKASVPEAPHRLTIILAPSKQFRERGGSRTLPQSCLPIFFSVD